MGRVFLSGGFTACMGGTLFLLGTAKIMPLFDPSRYLEVTYFFDEPTAHLDQESRDEYYQYLKKQKDKIIVVVSHNSQERQYFDVIYEV